MLDVAYPSWTALIRDLRSIRAYLRSCASELPDTPEQYNLSRIRPMYEERCTLRTGQPVVYLACITL